MKPNWMYMANWSPRELQAIGMFAEKTLSKLRRLQGCVVQQIELISGKPDNWFTGDGWSKHDVIWRLQRMELILTAAVDKKCFKQ